MYCVSVCICVWCDVYIHVCECVMLFVCMIVCLHICMGYRIFRCECVMMIYIMHPGVDCGYVSLYVCYACMCV